MNGYNFLELAVKDILRVINPSKEDWSVRFHIINEVRAVAESIESLRGATVEPFGSFASNLFTKWGDLDISIELQNGSYISSPGRKHKQSLLGDVLRALRKKGGFRRLQFISNARVPILKFESFYNISCDISINNLSGQMKSKMLFWINEIDGRFRDLVLLFSDICSSASTHGISPYAGQSEDIDSNMRWLPKTYALFVEDPFEQPANTARTVSSNQLIKISDAIQATHGILTSPNHNQTSLVSALAGEHICRSLMRASVSTPVIKSGTRNPGANHSRNDLKTRPERRQTPLQTQNKPQNKRMDKRQNDATNGPMHASTSQKQQVWRPRSQTKVDQIGSDG
ncbi:UNVERIFIED_CONTAM: protein HESO1 [Sesamum latifolium]|uniref:Protein HESO1 n=1 Tax=Sesamum latifolium TaxID=2727402 RepID=A0AAW2TAA8_9LAMI